MGAGRRLENIEALEEKARPLEEKEREIKEPEEQKVQDELEIDDIYTSAFYEQTQVSDISEKEKEENIATLQLDFPLPTDSTTLEEFLASENGENFKKGVKNLVDRLKDWANKNTWEEKDKDKNKKIKKLFSDRLDAFYTKQFTKYSGGDEEYNTRVFGLYTEGVRYLAGFVKRLDSEKNFLHQRKSALYDLFFTPTYNDVTLLPLDEWACPIVACEDGAAGLLYEGYITLGFNLKDKLTKLRINKLTKIVTDIIKSLDEDNPLRKNCVRRGWHTHFIAFMINRFGDRLGIPKRTDSYADSIEKHEEEPFTTFYTEFIEKVIPRFCKDMSKALDVELIAEELVDTINIQPIINTTEMNIDKKFEAINSALKPYGNDPEFTTNDVSYVTDPSKDIRELKPSNEIIKAMRRSMLTRLKNRNLLKEEYFITETIDKEEWQLKRLDCNIQDISDQKGEIDEDKINDKINLKDMPGSTVLVIGQSNTALFVRNGILFSRYHESSPGVQGKQKIVTVKIDAKANDYIADALTKAGIKIIGKTLHFIANHNLNLAYIVDENNLRTPFITFVNEQGKNGKTIKNISAIFRTKEQFHQYNLDALKAGDFDTVECLLYVFKDYIDKIKSIKVEAEEEKAEQDINGNIENYIENYNDNSFQLNMLLYLVKFTDMEWYDSNPDKSKKYILSLIESLSQDQINQIIYNTEILYLLSKVQLLSVLYEKIDPELLPKVLFKNLSESFKRREINVFQNLLGKEAKSINLDRRLLDLTSDIEGKEISVLSWAMTNKINVESFKVLITNLSTHQFTVDTLNQILTQAVEAESNCLLEFFKMLHPENKKYAVTTLINLYFSSSPRHIKDDLLYALLLEVDATALDSSLLNQRYSGDRSYRRDGTFLTAAAQVLNIKDFKTFLSKIKKDQLKLATETITLPTGKFHPLVEIASYSKQRYKEVSAIVDDIDAQTYIDYLTFAANSTDPNYSSVALSNLATTAHPQVVDSILLDEEKNIILKPEDINIQPPATLFKSIASQVSRDAAISFAQKGNPEVLKRILVNAVSKRNIALFITFYKALDSLLLTAKLLSMPVPCSGIKRTQTLMQYARSYMPLDEFENFISHLQSDELALAVSSEEPEENKSTLEAIFPFDHGTYAQTIVEKAGHLLPNPLLTSLIQKDVIRMSNKENTENILAKNVSLSLYKCASAEVLNPLIRDPKLTQKMIGIILTISDAFSTGDNYLEIISKIDSKLFNEELYKYITKKHNNISIDVLIKLRWILDIVKNAPYPVVEKLFNEFHITFPVIMVTKEGDVYLKKLAESHPEIVKKQLTNRISSSKSTLSTVIYYMGESQSFQLPVIQIFEDLGKLVKLTDAQIEDEILFALKTAYNHLANSNEEREKSLISTIENLLDWSQLPALLDNVMKIKSETTDQTLFSWSIEHLSAEHIKSLLSDLTLTTIDSCFKSSKDKGMHLLVSASSSRLSEHRQVFQQLLTKASSEAIKQALTFGFRDNELTEKFLFQLFPIHSHGLSRHTSISDLETIKLLLASAPSLFLRSLVHIRDSRDLKQEASSQLYELCYFVDVTRAKSNILNHPDKYIDFLKLAIEQREPAPSDYQLWRDILHDARSAAVQAKKFDLVTAINTLEDKLNYYAALPSNQLKVQQSNLDKIISNELRPYVKSVADVKPLVGRLRSRFSFTTDHFAPAKHKIALDILNALSEQTPNWDNILISITEALKNDFIQRDTKCLPILRTLKMSIVYINEQLQSMHIEEKIKTMEIERKDEKEILLEEKQRPSF